jgi:thiamine monophosphate synthase
MLFDWLVVGQVLPTNPARAVPGPKHSVISLRASPSAGRAPVIIIGGWPLNPVDRIAGDGVSLAQIVEQRGRAESFRRMLVSASSRSSSPSARQ